MRRLLITMAMALVAAVGAHGATSTITGTIKDAQGNPVNGTLTFQLPIPAVDTATNTAVAPNVEYYRLVNGVIQSGPPLYDVAGLQPQNLYYIAKAYDSAGNLVLYGNYVVTGASFNFGSAVPTTVTTSNISFVNLGNVANKNVPTDAIRYVTGTGSDSNDGLSWGTAKATIQVAVASLPTIAGKPSGFVFIGQGVNIPSGSEVTVGPFTKLVFTPQSTVTYNGTGTAITCSDAPTTYTGDGGIFDLNLNVTNNAGNGIQINECTWYDLNQVWIQGTGTASTGIPILLSNTQKWTEQSNFNLIHIQNFVNGITFQDNCGGHVGCPSFAYSRWRHVVVSPVGASNYGFQLQNDASWNGSDLELQCLGGAQAITCLSLTGTSSVNLMRLKIGGETSGPASVGISTAVGTIFAPVDLWERWNSGTFTDSFSGTQIGYIYNVPGFSFLQSLANGVAVGNFSNGFIGNLIVTGLTASRNFTMPDVSGTLETVVNSGSTALNTGALGSAGCEATITVVAANVTTSSRITWNYATDPSAVAGYGGAPIDAVHLLVWPTAGNVNFKQCSSVAVTPGSISILWNAFN